MNLWTSALLGAGVALACAGAGAQTTTPAAPSDTPAAATAPDHGTAVPVEKAERMPGRKDAWLYIGWPNNGETVNSHFKVWFGLRNFGVAPAGVRKEGTGHHHLLIDTDLKNFDEPIPNDKKHLHFGKGQTETMLDLPPGRHTLQLVLADQDHVPHNPPIMSKKITITVRPEGPRPPQVSAR